MRNCRTMKRIMSISLDGVQTLVLGSMTLDVVLRLDALPGRMEDVNIHAQQLCIGGCAYNVYQAMKCCGSSARLLTQRGSGMYAEELDRRSEGDPDILTVVAEGENGCCYCLVEPDGERSFLSLHGVEYHYPLAQLAQMDLSALRFVYLCGIDLEEAGDEVLTLLGRWEQLQIFFAPGPRVTQQGGWKSIYAHHPILHLNEAEACALSGQADAEMALQKLYAQTHAPVILTMGERGSMAYDGKRLVRAAACPCRVVDTIGAGDAHAGACLAMLEKGASIEEMLRQANALAARAVSGAGALRCR